MAHIIYGHISKVDGTTEEDENCADEYAKNTLISEKQYQEFIARGDFSKISMINFANQVGIDVGIVVGRLQKEGYIQYNWNI